MMTQARITTQLLSALLLLCGHRFIRADEFQEIAAIVDDRIDESSGIAASRTHPGSLWIHNDSGDSPRLFLIRTNGETLATVNVIDAVADDWEDMCSFEADGQAWLLIGDIGDNDEKRNRNQQPCTLYLLKEPKIPDSNGQPSVRWPFVARIPFEYDDGPHNCECVAVDVERNEILLLTKQRPGKCGLYVLPLTLDPGPNLQTARRIASPFLPFATAMDVSPNGRQLIIASMLDGVCIRRASGQTWTQAFQTGSSRLPLPKRRQGETICFDTQGRAIFVNSEAKRRPLWKRIWKEHD